MLKEMIKVARTNAEKGGYTNVEFIEARITDIPLKEETADVVISNCVLNWSRRPKSQQLLKKYIGY